MCREKRMRTIYLQKSLSINGRRALGGRRLVDRFREVSEDLLLGHIVWSEARAITANPGLEQDIISEVEMLRLNPDVIFLEGGFFTGKGGGWRVEQELAKDFVEKGGTLIVADVDVNILREQQTEYRNIAGFLGAIAAYRDREPVLGYDTTNYWK